MDNPDSVIDWLRLSEQHRIAAQSLAEDRKVAAQALFHVGLAVECMLKAYIMHRERLNCWPDKASRGDLYTHDLRKLAEIAKIEVKVTDPHAPAWSVLRQWDRNQGYNPKPMPRKVARSWCDAAFGTEGVVTWIRQKLPQM